MDNESKIPESWAMPEQMARKVNERLNRKTLRPEDDLSNALAEMAQDIALIEPDLRDWAGWVIYLLEQMELEAKRREKKEFLMRC